MSRVTTRLLLVVFAMTSFVGCYNVKVPPNCRTYLQCFNETMDSHKAYLVDELNKISSIDQINTVLSQFKERVKAQRYSELNNQLLDATKKLPAELQVQINAFFKKESALEKETLQKFCYQMILCKGDEDKLLKNIIPILAQTYDDKKVRMESLINKYVSS